MKTYITNFYSQIKNSIYGPEFYKNLENKSLFYSFIYVVKLSFLVSLISTFILVLFIRQFETNILQKAGVPDIGSLPSKYVETYFADDLVITINNDNLTTNKTELVNFPVPYDWFEGEKDDSGLFLDNLVIISPNELLDSSTFSQYNTYLMMSSTTAGFFDPEKNTVQFYNYQELRDKASTGIPESFIVTKSTAQNYAIIIGDYINNYSFLVFFFITTMTLIVLAFMITVGTLVFCLVLALITLIVGKIWKSETTYINWYKKAIFANTSYILLAWSLGWLLPITGIPFFNTILVFSLLLINKNFNK